MQVKTTFNDASIPDKIYFTIGEVVILCSVKPHVIRHWETEFTALSPVRRRGNRRYYQKKDVQLIRRIRNLLYVQGYTLDGARQQLESMQKQRKVSIKKRDTLDCIYSDLAEIADLLS